ncbi:MAG: universal stress protein [Actinomycetota bacterium]|nr:universal stress protein [Actinomycetota bacterium]
MFDKAVVCTDLTADSASLVACAAGLSSVGVREVVLTHVVDVFSDNPDGPDVGQEQGHAFERQIETLETSGLQVRVEATVGFPAYSLQDITRRHGASLIVVGSHGKGIYSTPFSGSVSSDILTFSDTPVLIVSPAVLSRPDAMACQHLLGHVLCATDFSECAQRAFDVAAGLVDCGARRYALMHVQDSTHLAGESSAVIAEFDRKDAVRLNELRECLLRLGADEVDTEIVFDSPSEAIASRAESGRYTLVIMGSHGRSRGGGQSTLGGVSDSVVKRSEVPVLLVPEAAVMQGNTTEAEVL